MARSFPILLLFLFFLATVIGKKGETTTKDPLAPNFIPSSHERTLSHRPKHQDEDLSIEDGSKLAHYGLSGRRRLIPSSIKYDGAADYARVHDPSTDTRYHPKIWTPPPANETEEEEGMTSMPEENGTQLNTSFVPPISSPRLPGLSPVPLPPVNPDVVAPLAIDSHLRWEQGVSQIIRPQWGNNLSPHNKPTQWQQPGVTASQNSRPQWPQPTAPLAQIPRPQWPQQVTQTPRPQWQPAAPQLQNAQLQWSQPQNNLPPQPRPAFAVPSSPPNYRNPAPFVPQQPSWPQQSVSQPQIYQERPVQYPWIQGK